MRVKVVFLLAVLGVLGGCTANERARQFGGEMRIELPAGEKFLHATWKEGDLWYATRPMRPGETPEVVTLREDSRFGMLEGMVVFQERAK